MPSISGILLRLLRLIPAALLSSVLCCEAQGFGAFSSGGGYPYLHQRLVALPGCHLRTPVRTPLVLRWPVLQRRLRPTTGLQVLLSSAAGFGGACL